MNYSQLLNQYIEELNQTFTFKESVIKYNLLNDFGNISTNLTLFQPNMKSDMHVTFYNKNKIYYKMAFLSEMPNVLDEIEMSKESQHYFFNNKNTAKIILTFHFGPYLALGHLLAANNFNFTFLSSNKNNQAFTLNETIKNTHNLAINPIIAEESNALFRMIKSLKSGKSILVYLDGNIGSNSKLNENVNEIEFLNNTVLIKNGSGYISYLTDTPIQIIISSYTKYFKPNFFVSDLIYPDKTMDKNAYNKYITQLAYNMLANHINILPEQWSFWNQNTKSIKPKTEIKGENDYNLLNHKINLKNNENYTFNLDKFILLNTKSNLSGDYYLLDKSILLSYYINKDLGNLLLNYIENSLNIESNLLNQLIYKNVLFKKN